jgi:tetratricopeptide (TPR) repeat protein
MNLGDYPEAIENLEVSLSNYMNNKECYIDLGTCYRSLGMEDEANKIFKEIVEFFG